MAFDPIRALREGGNPLDMLTDDQRSVLANLTEDEVSVWNSIKSRLDAVAGDVEGQDVNLNL